MKPSPERNGARARRGLRLLVAAALLWRHAAVFAVVCIAATVATLGVTAWTLRRLLGALAAGGLTAVLATLALAEALGAPREVALSLAQKSATMPIAMAAAERAGGIPALAAMAVVARWI